VQAVRLSRGWFCIYALLGQLQWLPLRISQSLEAGAGRLHCSWYLPVVVASGWMAVLESGWMAVLESGRMAVFVSGRLAVLGSSRMMRAARSRRM